MPRWMWWAPFGLLLVGCALIGLRYGWIAATITETDVIMHYAHRYVAEHGPGAALTDCYASPGAAGVWIAVRCLAPDGEVYVYHADRFGGLVEGVSTPSKDLGAPEA